MAHGRIEAINSQMGRMAVRTDRGYVIADIHCGEASVGDSVRGVMDDHGDQVWQNVTQGDEVEVYVEAFDASPETARTMLRLTG